MLPGGGELSRQVKGVGLGLNLVHHIVLRMEERSTLESRQGEGSTFTIRSEGGFVTSGPRAQTPMTRILLVEDEPTTRGRRARRPAGSKATRWTLRWTEIPPRLKGKQGQYDLILLDVMLPKKDGFACAASFGPPTCARRSSCSPRADRSSTRCSAWSSAPTITSPSRSAVRELQSRVKAALRRGAMSAVRAAEVYELDGLTIDFRRCEYEEREDHVELTALEIKMLRRPSSVDEVRW